MANPATFIALLDAARHFAELERLRDTRPSALGGEAAAIRAVRTAGEALQAAAVAYAATVPGKPPELGRCRTCGTVVAPEPVRRRLREETYPVPRTPSATPTMFIDEPTATPVAASGEETTKVHRVPRRQPSAER